MKVEAVFSLLKQTVNEWIEDNAPMLGAALAYYTVFSMAPLLLICISIAGIVFGEDAARGQIFDQLRQLIGEEGGRAVQDVVQSSASQPGGGLISTVVGIATLLFGASVVFGQLQASLNQIWGVAPQSGGGIMAVIKNRFLSVGFILVVGFLLLVSLIVTAVISFTAEWLGSIAPGTESLVHLANFLLSLAVITVLFAMMFKFLPDARIAWRDVWIGAFLTAVLFSVGKFGLGIYLGTTSVGSSYGAAGSIIVLLVWVYYSAQIFFFGAELTQVWANRYGSRVVAAGAGGHSGATKDQNATPMAK